MKNKLIPYFLFANAIFIILVNDCRADDCKSDEFNCGKYYECLPNSDLCNGKIDCSTKIDETFETCKDRRCNTTQFHCASGACIPLSLKCNTVPDCYDGSDEADCDNFNTNECLENWQIRCLSGECIRQDQICDGIKDCVDNSDETYTTCSNTRCSNTFQCDYGACVELEAICDGKPDCVDYSDELLPKCNTVFNVTDETICGKNRFKCNSGLCIKKENLCNGIRDCDDGSDETYRQCHNFNCDTTQKQCTYGACGVKSCVNDYYTVDISITTPKSWTTSTTPKLPQSILIPCPYPSQPENGEVRTNEGKIPTYLWFDASAPYWTVLIFKCNDGYTLGIAESTIVCNGEGQWTHPFPKCIKTCPPLVSKIHEIECSYEGYKVPCDKPFDGTLANVKCKEAFEIKNFLYQPYNGMKCQNGKWSHKLFDCNPECGTLIAKAEPLITKGYTAPKTGYPWHAGIYKHDPTSDECYEHICGGTLISNRLVVSAAHCFWYGNKPDTNPRNYAVAVGKFYRTWKSNKDKYGQYKQVQEIITHTKFRAEESSFANDIAIIILKCPVRFTNIVRPICIDWSNQLYEEVLKRGNFSGIVSGWGLTEEFGSFSEELQSIKMPYVEYNSCLQDLPVDFRPAITYDKICAGFHNGTSVCNGDSGGGYIFNWKNRHFICGIVSVGPSKSGYLRSTCDSYQYVAFTSFSKHLDLIKTYEKKFDNN